MTRTDTQGSLSDGHFIDAVNRNTMEQIGEYVVRRLVGEGGMGKVYEAEERLSEKVVALKVLRNELSRSDTGRKLFLNEMKILAKLDHPNIVRSLASFEHEDNLVLVLEYLDGETLRQTLLDETRLDWRRAAHVGVQVANALDGAHSQTPTVVHRDLKPDNIMLLERSQAEHGWDIDRAKVMDFGIAKVLQELTQTHTQSVGTLQYMSPEQIDARAVDGRSDLYCLGLILYEMVSGEPPFSSPSPRELLNLQCTAKPPALPPEVRDALPDGLEPLIFQLLAKDPDQRPETAAKVRKKLQRMLDKAPDAEVPARDSHADVEPGDVVAGAVPAASSDAEDQKTETGKEARDSSGDEKDSNAETSHDTKAAHKKAADKKKTSDADKKKLNTRHLVEGSEKTSSSKKSRDETSGGGTSNVKQMLLVAVIAFAAGALVLFLFDPLGGRRGDDDSSGGDTIENGPGDNNGGVGGNAGDNNGGVGGNDNGGGGVIDPVVKERITARDDLAATHTTNDGAVMQRITAGPFLLGSPNGVGDVDEQPQRNQVLADYFIDTTEVTVSAFQQCVSDGTCGRNLFTSGLDQARSTGRTVDQATCNFDVPGRESFPMNCVSAKAASQFCAWRSTQDALLSYRLPTEAEWEKAARGTDGRTFPWGEQVANCSFAAIGNCGQSNTGTVASTSGDVSPNGVMDMAGRVSEWVLQVYNQPLDENALARGEIGTNLRGGNWKTPSPIRVADRDASPVPLGDTGFGADDVGFRCVGLPK